MLTGALVALSLYQWFAFPWIWGTGVAGSHVGTRLWLLTLLPGALMSNTLWSLAHEGIHGSLHPEKHLNHRLGRLLGWCFGSSFAAFRTAHLLHHRYSRMEAERTEVYDPDQTGRPGAALGYYSSLLGLQYLGTFLIPMLSLAPRGLLKHQVERNMPASSYTGKVARELVSQPGLLDEIRVDGRFLAVLYGMSIFLYARAHALWIPFSLLALRAFFISYLDYVYHYGAPLDDPRHGYNLRLPAPFSKLLLHFNFHGVHHRMPSLPWRVLPEAFASEGQAYDGDYLAAAAAQSLGPIAVGKLRDR